MSRTAELARMTVDELIEEFARCADKANQATEILNNSTATMQAITEILESTNPAQPEKILN